MSEGATMRDKSLVMAFGYLAVASIFVAIAIFYSNLVDQVTQKTHKVV